MALEKNSPFACLPNVEKVHTYDTRYKRIAFYSTLNPLLFASRAIGQEPIALFEATDSRGKVIRAAYAYYPVASLG